MGVRLPSGGALLGLALAITACRPKDAPRPAWSFLAAVPDTVLLDTAAIEWASSGARVWLRSQSPARLPHLPSAAALDTRHEVSCARGEIRDLEIRALGGAGDVLRDSLVPAPSWIQSAVHPVLQGLLPALCTRLSLLAPRGLHNLLGSDRP